MQFLLQRLRRHIRVYTLGFMALSLTLVSLLWLLTNFLPVLIPQQSSTSPPTISTLDVISVDRLDELAHAYGYHLHVDEQSPRPVIGSFGSTPADSREHRVAGLDQWLAANLGPSPQGYGAQNDARQFSGEYRLLVLRVFFPDLPVDLSDPERTPRYTRQEVEDRFNTEIAELWARNSWGQVTLRAEVAPDVMLNYWEGANPGGRPWPRALYTDGARPWFNGNQIRRAALQSAISAFAAGGQAWQDSWRGFLPTMWEGDNFKWSEIDGVLVYIIDTPAIVTYVQNTPQVTWNTTTRRNIYFDSYRGTNGCGAATGFPVGVSVGCGSIMEGVGQTKADPPAAIWKAENSVWGAWAHEVGHMLQEPGAGHPSRYQNRFELMDSNTPGQTGAYTRQSQEDFAGWMPADRMRIVAADEPGAYVSLSTLAYGLDQANLSVHRAVRVELPGTDEYYMLSVRRQILGDELQPIPDEGLLIERVNPNGYDPVVHETACSRLNDFSLRPGEFCTFEIGFKPTIAGLYSGDLQLQYDNGRLSVLLDARGVNGDNQRAPLGNEPVGNPNELFMFPFTRTVSGNLTYNFGDAGIAPAAPPLVALITLRNNGAVPHQIERIWMECAEGNTCPEFTLSRDLALQCPIGAGKFDGPNDSSDCGKVRVMGALDTNARESRDILWKFNGATNTGDVYDSSSFTGWYMGTKDSQGREIQPAGPIQTDARPWRRDGIRIEVRDATTDTYGIYITRSAMPGMADMMIRPWRSNPNPGAYETTDIWVDSPVNGYCGGGAPGTRIVPPDADGVAACSPFYTYGVRSNPNDPFYGTVVGHGDTPTVGLPNRLYARLRNLGNAKADNVTVHFEIRYIDGAPALGIGPGEWVAIDSLTPAQDPRLNNLGPDSVTDVFVNWTPDPALFPAIAEGRFDFHSCVRVRLELDEEKDRIRSNHTVSGPDGLADPREEENIDIFEAVLPAASTDPVPEYRRTLQIRNFDLQSPRTFELYTETDLPPNWLVKINEDQATITLNPGESRAIPVEILPQGEAVVGSVFKLHLGATFGNVLYNELNPDETHLDDSLLGGVTIESWVKSATSLEATASPLWEPDPLRVEGRLNGIGSFYTADLRLLLVQVNSRRHPILDTIEWVTVNSDGSFSASLPRLSEHAADKSGDLLILFAGTKELASASLFVPIGVEKSFLPLIVSHPAVGATPTAIAATPTSTPFATTLPTNTPTATPTPTNTPTTTAIPTSTPTATLTPTSTPTATPTPTSTPTATLTPTNTPTTTAIPTSTPTATLTPTSTPTATPTPTSTPTATLTPTSTPTATPTPTSTPTATLTPQTKILQPSQDAYVDSSRPSTNFGTDLILRVGNDYGAATYRSYIAFDLATAIPMDATIVSATLQISQTNIFGYEPEYRISVYKPESLWAETDLNWENQPTLQDTGLSGSINMESDWQTINITQLVADWVGQTAQVSLVLRSQDETIETARDFASRHGASPPELIVTYTVP